MAPQPSFVAPKSDEGGTLNPSPRHTQHQRETAGQLLWHHFETLAETPEAIQKIRAFILDLAIRGRLVPQTTKPDEDAAWQKFRSGLSEVDHKSESPPPFEIPGYWRWATLHAVAEPCGQKQPDERFTYIDVGAIDNVRGTITPDLQTLEADEAPSRARKLVRSNSVIYSTVRPNLRNIAVIDEEFDPPAIVSTAFAVLHPKPFLNSRFLFYWLRSAPFQEDVAAKMKGVAYPAISDSDLWECPIPVPPREEQRRIVAKVEELLALCDELEARQTAAREHRTRLVRSALDHPTAAKDESDFKKYSAFSLQHSALIFDSVPALRQAILSLAIQGKLVPQAAGDEPVSDLFEQIQARKEKLQAEGLYKQSKPLPSIAHNERRFVLPQGWGWFRLRSLVFTLGDGLHGTPEYVGGTNYHFINGNNLVDGRIIIKPNTKTVSIDEMRKHKKLMTTNTVLVSINGTLGNVAFYNNENIVLGKSACYFNLVEPIDKRFVRLVIESQYFIEYALQNATGSTIRNLSLEAMNTFPFPLPPLAEQQRIVAKVNDLMRWCDTLEARLTAAQTTATHLLDATLRQMLNDER
jgi:type I restriction enzyme, S subunit